MRTKLKKIFENAKILNYVFIALIALLIAAIISMIVFWPRVDKNEVLNKVNNSENIKILYPIKVEPSDPEEAQVAIKFYCDLTKCFFTNDVNSFNKLIREGQMPWITLSGENRQCSTIYMYPSDVAERVYIKKGKLIEVSTETNPPEVETGLSAALFGEDEPGFRESLTKEGFLSYATWSDADIDYINQHFDAIYNELAWTIELYQNDAGKVGWVIYKIPNNTYLISNGKSWYSDKTSSREFSGKVFVVKKINDELYDNELKIVAFIDVQ